MSDEQKHVIKRAHDTRKGDRHAPGYMAKYLREWRAKRKAERLSTLTPSKANLPTPLKVKTDE